MKTEIWNIDKQNKIWMGYTEDQQAIKELKKSLPVFAVYHDRKGKRVALQFKLDENSLSIFEQIANKKKQGTLF